MLERSFPLLESALRAQGGADGAPSGGNGERATPARPTPAGLDALLGQTPSDVDPAPADEDV